MTLHECARFLSRFSLITLAYNLGRLELVYSLLEKKIDAHELEGMKMVCSDVDVIVAPYTAVEADISWGEAGGILSSFLLLRPTTLYGNKEYYSTLLARIVDRAYKETLYRLAGLFDIMWDRLWFAAHMPSIAFLSLLARLYPWLRPTINAMLYCTSYHQWVSKVSAKVADTIEYVSRVPGTPYYKLVSKPVKPSSETNLVSLVEAIQITVDPSRTLEGLKEKLHPLLRDPLLLAKLDSARLATRLLDFQDQLFAITGVKAELTRIYRQGIVRAAARIEAKGYTPAIVKWYAKPIALKWLLVYILALHLPKPRIPPRKRLAAEYKYNRLLAEKGYDVPRPLLIDPRRLVSAYEYIEGKTLSDLIREKAVPEEELTRLGGLLASLHRDDIGLWDTNPSNFVFSQDKIYVVDLEQARENPSLAEKAWDIALAAYYPSTLLPRKPEARARLLAKGYLDGGGDPRVVLEASRPRYMIPFLTAVAPNVLESIRRVLQRVALEALKG